MIEQHFKDRKAAAQATAEAIAAALRRRLASEDEVALVVSGGSTPVPVLLGLSAMALDWSRVHVVPSDERWVPADHEESNEHMIRGALMRNHAADARLVSLYRAGRTPEEACDALQPTLEHLPLPMAATLLGMGTDGHFASLFPDYDGLEDALDLSNEHWCAGVRTAGSPHPRLSLTLPALACSDRIILLIFGDEKRQVLEDARAGRREYPVSALLAQNRAPLHVIWAP